jgi:hypothetical protein
MDGHGLEERGRDAGRQTGLNFLNANDEVMPRGSAYRRARLAQTTSLDCATHDHLRTLWASCRLRWG